MKFTGILILTKLTCFENNCTMLNDNPLKLFILISSYLNNYKNIKTMLLTKLEGCLGIH